MVAKPTYSQTFFPLFRLIRHGWLALLLALFGSTGCFDDLTDVSDVLKDEIKKGNIEVTCTQDGVVATYETGNQINAASYAIIARDEAGEQLQRWDVEIEQQGTLTLDVSESTLVGTVTFEILALNPEFENGVSDPVQSVTIEIDADRDGSPKIACGGFDCKDDDAEMYPGNAETCDAKDNDCNGVVDDNLPDAPLADLQQGPCEGIVKICNVNGGWQEPNYADFLDFYEQTEQSCDGQDNDCNGEIDDGLPGLDDGNPCTLDLCDSETKAIIHLAVENGLECDDEQFCTLEDQCVDGVCTGTARDCSAFDDACNEGVCNEDQDSCAASPLDEGTACDNGLFCDGAETCDGEGTCAPGQAVYVDDGVSCTADACIEGADLTDNLGEIVHTPHDSLCNDGVGCTVDLCDPIDDCQFTPDDSSCQDGLYCNGAEVCDTTQDCQSGTPVAVDDNVSCTVDSCSEGSDTSDNQGEVLHHPNDALCQDGLYCNGAETCDATLDCQNGTPIATDDEISCTADACDEGADQTDNLGEVTHTPDDGLCNDNVGCTVDTCDPTNDCQFAPDDSLCQDGLYCNGAETCDATLDCQNGTPIATDDEISCTADACDEGADQTDNLGEVTHTPDDGLCNDNVGCTVDTCDPTNDCQFAPDDSLCQDGLFCNGAETCDATLDCQNGTPIATDDEISCTADACDEGADQTDNLGEVTHTPDDGLCNDNVGCTVDTCDPTNDCQFAPDDSLCQDGLYCNGAETCDATLDCQNGTPIATDDEISCTADACDEGADQTDNLGEVTHTPDDGLCNDNVGCTVDTCDPTNDCQFAPEDALCQDGLYCNGAETCDATLDCQNGTPIATDDEISCTADACDEGADQTDNLGEVTHTPDDGLCNDNVGCTVDTCDPTNDCQFAPDDSLCQDGLFCNGAETCDATLDCQNGTPIATDDEISCTADACDEGADQTDNLGELTHTPDDGLCNDNVGCTVDTCDPTNDCQFAPDDSLCQDGLYCNGAETCNATLDCQDGTAVVIDDEISCTTDACDEGADETDNLGEVTHTPDDGLCNDNVGCTVDTCDLTNGCVFAPDDSLCQDGLYCNGAETCDATLDCQDGTAVVIDDEISCTTDACDEGADETDNLGEVTHTPDDGLCNDNVGCTVDTCDLTNGCVFAPDDSLCQDGLYCNGAETCDATLDCQDGTAVVIDDEISCTTDACDEGADETDNLGEVTHTPDDGLCNDNVGCTVDTCDPTNDCQFAPDDSLCQDGLYCNGAETCDATLDCQDGTTVVIDDEISCTADACDEGSDETDNLGEVTHTPDDGLCNDNVGCTVDTCDLTNGCVFAPDDFLCQDGLYCNGAETCDATLDCQDGTAVVIDDEISCTADVCDEGPDETDNIGEVTHTPDDGLCNDNVGCTVDTCDLTDGCVFAPDDSLCQDGLYCNGAETCDATLDCQDGTAVVIDDEISCTADACDEGPDETDNIGEVTHTPDDGLCNDNVGCTVDTCDLTDGCVFAPDDSLCQDGLYCNGAETCNATLDCQDGTAVVIDDEISCTADACDEGPDETDNLGEVTHTPDDGLCNDNVGCTVDTCDLTNGCVFAPDDSYCSNDLFCDGTETCDPLEGDATTGCKDGVPPTVDDNVSCTVDACDEENDTVTHEADNTLCNDDIACTIDTCHATQDCQHYENHGYCDNLLFCDGEETCDAEAGGDGCVNGTPPETDDGIACTDDSCDEENDLLLHEPNDSLCTDDGVACTVESCNPALGCERQADDSYCDDGVSCSIDTCDPVSGAPVTGCLYTADDTVCDDGLWCTGLETCDLTNDCLDGEDPELDDAVTCTLDYCNEETDTVEHLAFDSDCNDNLFCNGVEWCDPVQDCQNGTPPATDDGIACTIDQCDETDGVTHTPDNTACTDGIDCTDDTCDVSLGCTFIPNHVFCADEYSCTVDTCDVELGSCQHESDDTLCLDDEPCNGVESCSPSSPGADGTTGCLVENIPGEGSSCDDDSEDCVSSTCQSGVCTAETLDDCTSCASSLGLCASGACLLSDIVDGFESGDFLSIWSTSGDSEWQVTSNSAASGSYSAVSGSLDHGQTAVLDLLVSLEQDGGIEFSSRVDSEPNGDTLTFYVYTGFMLDGQFVDFPLPLYTKNWSGSVDWNQFEYNLSAGTYRLSWVYTKDGSITAGADAAWIDDVLVTGVSSTTCDDGNPCTRNLDGDSGCVSCNVENGTSCGETQSGDCLTAPTCQTGVCSGGQEPAGTACSDDGNPCTVDLCDEAGQCTHPNAEECTHCGDNQYCSMGVCGGLDNVLLVTEDFESETLPEGWSASGDADWSISSGSYSGDKSVISGEISSGQTSILEKAVTLEGPALLQFYLTMDLNDPQEFLRFYVDDTLKYEYSGSETSGLWQNVQQNLDTGDHTLKWIYSVEEENTSYNRPRLDFLEIERLDGYCDDVSYCTSDLFDGTSCLHCNIPDDRPCTTSDECKVATGLCGNGVCVADNLPDGTPCSAGRECESGVCTGHADCDDDNPCTVDTWDGVCHHEPLVQGTPCPDVLYCNGIEICNGEGSCVAGTPPYLSDHVPCTDDQCDEENDRIVHLPNNDFCQDGLYCNGAEICDTYFGCQPGEAIDPDEGISCTEDHCDEGIDFSDNYGEVTHTPLDSLCDNGLWCDGAEWCNTDDSGMFPLGCNLGSGAYIPDDYDCTYDWCDEDNDQVVHELQNSYCDDDEPCNGVEICVAEGDPGTGCQTGTPLGEGDSCDEDPDDCYTLTCQSGECTSQQKNTGDPCGGEDDPYDCLSYACNDVGQCLKTASDDCTACGETGESLCAGGVCGGEPIIIQENFESFPLSENWTTYNDGEWLRSTVQAYEADASMTVTGLSEYEYASTSLTFETKAAGTLRIRYMSAIDWENIGGELSFYLNSGYVFGSSDPTTDWETFELALSANQTYTFEIQYYHYSGDLSALEPFWIDDLLITGTGLECNDGNDCTLDLWNGDTCSTCAVADQTICDDGNSCTESTGACVSGECQASALADQTPCADDENPCTNDVCLSGTCEHGNLDNGVSCDSDGEDCIIETCQEGTCTAEKLADCSTCGADGYCADGLCGGYPVHLFEDFESGSLPDGEAFGGHGTWSTGGELGWTVVERTNPESGEYVAASGDIGSSQQSWLKLDIEVFTVSTISFYAAASTNCWNHYLYFYIDGSYYDYWHCNATEWEFFSATLSKGMHNLEWRYQKNSYSASYEDKVWIDDITIQPTDACSDGNGCTVGYQGEESCVFCQEPLEDVPCLNFGVDCRELIGTCHSGQCDSAFLPEGTACSDEGNPCTTNLCDASGDCQHEAGPEGVACEDDRNDCTQDHCDDAGQCQHEPITLGAECALGFDTCGVGAYDGICLEYISDYGQSGSARQWCADRGARLPTYDEWLAMLDAGWTRPSTSYRTMTVDDCPNCSEGTVCNMYAPGYSTPTNVYGCGDDTSYYYRGILCIRDDGYCDESGVCGIHDCDDGNPCTRDYWEGECKTEVLVDGSPCPSDDNACTHDFCIQGMCNVPVANGQLCNADDSICTQNDACHSGVCEPGEALDCSDGNPCTIDSCDPVDGCGWSPFTCDDGNSCTQNECYDDNGQPGCNYPPLDAGTLCDSDGKDCTADICDGSGTCTHPPAEAGVVCNDENPCTLRDRCDSNGLCIGTLIDCEDGLFCNGAEVCEPGTGCVAGEPLVLDDGIACTLDRCDEVADEIVHEPNHSFCNDGLICNGEEVCDTELGCVSGVNAIDGTDCDTDDEDCFVSVCRSGTCETDQRPDCSTCGSNGSLHCYQGDCGGYSSVVNETFDSCPDGCFNPDYAWSTDDDWTFSEETPRGYQLGEMAVSTCAYDTDETKTIRLNVHTIRKNTTVRFYYLYYDGSSYSTSHRMLFTVDDTEYMSDIYSYYYKRNTEFTVETPGIHTLSWSVTNLNSSSGRTPCLSVMNVIFDGDACADTVVCTNTLFTGDECLYCPVEDDQPCNDGNECTASIGSCQFGFCQSDPMPDGTPCAMGGSCNDGSCEQYEDCDDDNPCTIDSWTGTVCQNDFAPVGTDCDDGLFCNGRDTCDGSGECIAGGAPWLGDGIDCTDDWCDEENDIILHDANDENCDDDIFCNGAETCDPIRGCKDGNAPAIDDSIACTVDACDEENDNVLHTPEHILCNDSVDCTIDTCNPLFGGCINLPLDSYCDDSDPCSVDTCDPYDGCVNDPFDCDDGISCTTDTCETVEGEPSCTHSNLPYGEPCESDEDPCTLDICEEGACTHPPAEDGVSCFDDENPCTEDICLSGECKHTPVEDGTSCDENDSDCTFDSCQMGYCEALPLPDCQSCGENGQGLCAGGACNGVDILLEEDFESGVIPENWTSGGALPWTIENEGDNFSVRSGAIDHLQHTWLRFQVELLEPGTLSFDYRVRTDSYDDYLLLFVDETLINSWSGNINDYTNYTYGLDSGSHTIEFRYYKNYYYTSYEDTVWIDNVTVTHVSYECDDENPCTEDLYDGVACIACDAPNDIACDDGNSCTEGTLCQSGTCMGGASLDDGTACVDDANPCTSDTCLSGTCMHDAVDDETSCDGNAFDCEDYQCVSGSCESSTREDCAECGEAELCIGGVCGGQPMEILEGFDGNVLHGNWRTAAEHPWVILEGRYRSSSRSVGVVELPRYTSSWLEIEVDLKQTGDISFWYQIKNSDTYISFYINDSRQLYDSYAYSWESYSTSSLEPGHYTFKWVAFNQYDYDSTDIVTVDDIHITGLEAPCEDTDENSCTIETFDGESCIACDAVDGSECDDGDSCSAFDTCLGGECIVHESSIEGTPCEGDEFECTKDICNDSGTCTHPAHHEGTPCTDEGNECTEDICDGQGLCGHTPVLQGTECGYWESDCVTGFCNEGGECVEEMQPDDTVCHKNDCDQGVYAGYCLSYLSDYSLPGSARQWCADRNSRLLTYDEWIAVTDAGWLRPNSYYRNVPVENCPQNCSDGVCNMYAPTYSSPDGLYACGDTYDYRRGILCVSDIGACDNGECLLHVSCYDDNPCTIDSWSNGACRHELAPQGTQCDDEEVCTQDDVCDDYGECAGVAVDCNDGAFCNGVETCEPGTGCVYGQAPAVDDGVDCTQDFCDEENDAVLHVPMDSLCNDENYCNGVETCHLTLGCLSGGNLANGTSCDADPTDCRVSVCLDGECSTDLLPDCSPCGEDGDFSCAGGSCGGYGETFMEGFEFCAPYSGCFHPNVRWTNDEELPWQPIDLAMEGIEGLSNQPEGRYALKGQVFEYGQSTEIAMTFFTNDPNTEFSYWELRKNLTDYNSYIRCYIDDVLDFETRYDSSYWYQRTIQIDTVGEHEFRCNLSFEYNYSSTAQPIFYLDQITISGNICANFDEVDCLENLSAGTNCMYCPYPDGWACDDDNPCTSPIGTCESGVCDVEWAPNDTPCGEDSVCIDGVCIETDCNDDNPCTVDSWLVDSCHHEPLPEGSSCSDGVYCNGMETCDDQGQCLPGGDPLVDDGLACTDDACDEALDIPVHYPMDERCDDGLYCNGVETCNEFLGCQEGAAPQDPDDVWCTDEVCDEENDTILHVPMDEWCTDDNFCNGEETCEPLVGCQEGTPPDLDDGIDCTHDWCDWEMGILHDPMDDFCDDGEPCNGVETCNETLGCLEGTPLDEGAICDDDPDNCVDGTCIEGTCNIVNVDECSPCKGDDIISGYCFDGTCHQPLEFFHERFEDGMNSNWNYWTDNASWNLDETEAVEGNWSFSTMSGDEGEFFVELWIRMEIDKPAKVSWWQKLNTFPAELGGEGEITRGQVLGFGDGTAEFIERLWTGTSDWSMQEHYLAPGSYWLFWYYSGVVEPEFDDHIWLDDITVSYVDETCSDGNGCTIDFNVEGDCRTCAAAESAPCDDSNPCSDASICQSGECTPTSLLADGWNCWDGSDCMNEGTCQSGECQANPVESGVSCTEDENPCTSDSCNGLGECIHEFVTEGTPCTDDGNDCTSDLCNAIGECTHATAPLGTRCGTWNECELGQYGGVCLTHISDPCLPYGDSAKEWCQERGSELITHEEYLTITQAGWVEPYWNYDTIANDGVDLATCPDGVGNFWVPGDSDPDNMWRCGDTIRSCNRAALCVGRGGFCNGEICEPHSECRDEDPCTQEGWNGECFIEPSEDGTPCDDDGNPCTLDQCLDGECNTTVPDGTVCDADGSTCTPDDFCLSGVCVTGQSMDCDDGDPCTVDSCDDLAGCVHEPFSCDDENECTDDICLDDRGVPACDHVALDAGIPCNSDGNDCTEDVCDGTGICSHPPSDAQTLCDDDDACTEEDHCDGFGDCSGTPIDCDDGLFCNGVEVCNNNYGCQDGELPPMSDGVDCTIDTCNEETDTIEHVPDDSYCDDGNPCNGAETCHEKLGCRPGTYLADGTNCDEAPDDCSIQYCDDGLCVAASMPDCTACGSDGRSFCAGGECGGLNSTVNEGFESCAPQRGCLDSSYAWYNDEENPWVVRKQNDHGLPPYAGSYALFAKVDEEGETTSISLKFYTTQSYAYFSFRYMFYNGHNYNYHGTFDLSVDGESFYSTNYNSSYWSSYSNYIYEPGIHEITWEIRNDYSFDPQYPATLMIDSISVSGSECSELEECSTALFNGSSCVACPAVNGTVCDEGNPCTNGACQQGSCHIIDRDGQSCDTNGLDCTEDVCIGDVCTPQNLPDCTECLDGGLCGGGACYEASLMEEGFEDGIFGENWATGGDELWYVTNDLAYEGEFSAMAFPTDSYQNHELYYYIDLLRSARVTFWFKLDTPRGECELEFWSSYGSWHYWDETTDWQQASLYLDEGSSELVWYYYCRNTEIMGDNRVWVDNIRIEYENYCYSDENCTTFVPSIGEDCTECILPDGTDCDIVGDCTQHNICQDGECQQGNPVDNGLSCNDDGNPCTADSCLDGECVHDPVENGLPCNDDGNTCTEDVCFDGACTHDPVPTGTDCDDDPSDCTPKTCSEEGYCTVMDSKMDCEPCGGDGERFCAGGTCSGHTVVCDETFESGGIRHNSYGWSGDAYWAVAEDEAHTGTKSYASNPIPNSGDSEFRLYSVSLDAPGIVSFYLKTDTEADRDELFFAVDGLGLGTWSGDTDWTYAEFPLDAGDYTLYWWYSKDNSNFEGRDKVWIDDILVRTIPDPLCTDDLSCTADLMGEEACVFCALPSGLECEDGNACTQTGQCDGSGACQTSPVPDDTPCDEDDNPCTSDICQSGSCEHPPVTNDTPCDEDSLDCTNDTCQDGSCVPFAVDDCEPCRNGGYCAGGLCGGYGSNVAEDFESGEIDPGWQSGGEADWMVTGSRVYEGVYSATSGDIGDNQTSWLGFNVTLNESGQVSFTYKVESEEDGDFLVFYLDGQLVGQWSGYTDWTLHEVALEPGLHSLDWGYIKDYEDSEGRDRAWLDNISVTGIGLVCEDDNECTADLYNGTECIACSLPDQTACSDGEGVCEEGICSE